MSKYEVELSDTEDKAMSYVAKATQDWLANALKNRARIAKAKIIDLNMKHCNANDIQIASGEDAQITQAFDLKVVQAMKDVESKTLGD